MIYGAMRDKAIEEIAEILFPLAQELILTAPDAPRARSAGGSAGIGRARPGRGNFTAKPWKWSTREWPPTTWWW